MFKIFILFLSFTIFSCREKPTLFPPINSKQDIRIDSLVFEKIELDLEGNECSYYGYSYLDDQQICFIDQYLGQVFVFSPDGRIENRKLGQGRGPQEVACKNIAAVSKLKNGDLLIVGPSSDYYFFNDKYEKINTCFFSQNHLENYYESPDTYTLFYPNLIIKNFGEKLYYNIYSESENFNFIDTPEKYYKQAKTLMQNIERMVKTKRYLPGILLFI